MIEVYGDLWKYSADVTCITTNGAVTKAGNGIMGRGVALQAKQRFKGIEGLLGRSLKEYGNHCVVWTGPYAPICFFPVKHHWREAAAPNLIVRSAQELSEIAHKWPGMVFVLPRPGCGNGQLSWATVKPLIENILPDRVHVITLQEG